ncbi:MAG: hypothetical protein LC104_07675 [Bacteroidales bacterium]|nr:hypothetical protein [Bacteroidales bacterium]
MLAVGGLAMLGYNFGGGAVGRYYDGGQTVAGALVGSAADVSGVSAVYAGVTNRDIVAGGHLGLTVEQQREQLGAGGVQAAGTVLSLGGATRSFVKGKTPAAGKATHADAPPSAGAKAPPPAELTAPTTSAGKSAAGKTGTAEVVECATPPGCFAVGVPVAGEHGPVPIEAVSATMKVWARDEHDPDGPLVLCEVEEVFERFSLVWEVLAANGVVIRTTAEHPFWVVSRGWTDVDAIRPGERLVGRDGAEIGIESVRNTGRYERVYNFRVAGAHTYFVGCPEWVCVPKMPS